MFYLPSFIIDLNILLPESIYILANTLEKPFSSSLEKEEK